jgi:hypothetical protein
MAFFASAGLRDVDHDGDLDLVAKVGRLVSDQFEFGFAWVENTGFHHQRVAADINRDGRVDGADLGLVLVSWGTNP